MKHPNQLQAARKQSGKTQEQAAENLNMSVRSYQGYEYGMGAQTIRAAIRIAKMYNSTVEKLWAPVAQN